MKKSAFRRMMALFLSLLLCFGCLPGSVFADGEIIMKFPLPKNYFENGSIVDVAGCKGDREGCIDSTAHATEHGNIGMDIQVGAGEDVYAPLSGTMYAGDNVVIIEKGIDETYAYYIVLKGANAAIASGSSVNAGDKIASVSGSSLKFSAVMAAPGLGAEIASDPNAKLQDIWNAGWLATGTHGTGMINVNSSTAATLPGSISYQFVEPQAPAENTPHTHTFADWWDYDETCHWHAPTCGDTGDVLGYAYHTWDSGTVTTPASHTANGVRTLTCTTCGATLTELIPATEGHTFAEEWSYDDTYHWHAPTCGDTGDVLGFNYHSLGEWAVTTEPTHTEVGVKSAACSVCGATVTQLIPPAEDNHTFADTWSTTDEYHWRDATCGHSVVYGYNYHDWDQGTITVEATHTENGIKTFTCGTCGATRTEVIPVTEGHTYAAEWSMDDAHHWHEATCGHTGVAGNYGEHTWDAGVITVQPTATSTGVKTFTCTVCGKTRTETVEASHVHAFDQQIASADYLKSAATCTDPAVYYMSCTCGQKGETVFTYGAAAGHTFAAEWSRNDTHHWHAATCAHTNEVGSFSEHTWDAGTFTVQPTHTSVGEKTYTCTTCGQTRKETVAASAEHVFDQTVATDAFRQSAATCTTAAVYYKSCVCGQAGTETFTSGNPLGHTFSDQWQKNDTHHWHEATCGHTGEVGSFAEHTWDAGVVTVQPGHMTDGETTFTCTACGAVKKQAIPGNTHVFDMKVVDAKFLKSPATCTEAATYYMSCQCGEAGTETFTDGEALGHTFSNEWSKNETQHWLAATCEHTNERVKLADHIWDPGKITVQPTATTKGQKTYTCTTCGATRTEEVDATTHTHTFAEAWSMNESAHWHAATCGHTNEVSGFALHTWNNGVQTVAATHTTNGEIVYTCTTCGQTRREAVQAFHTFDQKIAGSAFIKSFASCNWAAEYYYSCVCGAKGTSSFAYGSPLGHSFSSSWTTDENYHWHACVICSTKGEIQTHSFDRNTNTCTICGYTKQDAHVHTSHLTRVPAKSPACTEDGSISYYTCECGQWFSDVTAASAITDPNSVIVPAAGHVDKDKNGKCDICKTQIAEANVEYKVTEGVDSTWINNSSQGMVFRADSDFSKFDHVEVDGATVSSLNYTVSSGSTIVELNANYLKRLTIGRHTISIVATDGKASTSFNIKQATAATNTAKEESGSSLWIVVAIIALLALIAAGAIVGYLFYTGRLGGSKSGGKFSR